MPFQMPQMQANPLQQLMQQMQQAPQMQYRPGMPQGFPSPGYNSLMSQMMGQQPYGESPEDVQAQMFPDPVQRMITMALIQKLLQQR